MKFKDLNIGEYFVHWDNNKFVMYQKASDNYGHRVTYNSDTGCINEDESMNYLFNWHYKVYKVEADLW